MAVKKILLYPGNKELLRASSNPVVDFNAVVVHHEIDHLDGVLFIDRCQSLDDLYRVYIDDQGNPVQVAVSDILHLEKKRFPFPVY